MQLYLYGKLYPLHLLLVRIYTKKNLGVASFLFQVTISRDSTLFKGIKAKFR